MTTTVSKKYSLTDRKQIPEVRSVTIPLTRLEKIAYHANLNENNQVESNKLNSDYELKKLLKKEKENYLIQTNFYTYMR